MSSLFFISFRDKLFNWKSIALSVPLADGGKTIDKHTNIATYIMNQPRC